MSSPRRATPRESAVLLAEDATRFHERFFDWGRYGISAFNAARYPRLQELVARAFPL
jgi:hypothetical protein